MRITLKIFLLTFASSLFSQDTLTFQKFLDYVLQNHPIIQNTQITTTQTFKAYLLKAKGQFDPKLSYDLQNKFFDNKNYFLYYNFEIKQPTYPGIDLNLNYNYASGMYINNDSYIPPSGLFSLGASVPVLRNLFYDERRLNLQTARLLNRNNKVFLNAQIINTLEWIIQDYLNFFEKFNLMLMYKNLVKTSFERYLNVKNAVKTGENAPIDTLDAGNQYQNFLLSYQKALLDYQNSKYQLLTHLNNSIDTSFVAPVITNSIVFQNLDTTNLVLNYPELKTYQIKLKQLQLERKLKIEFLKPQLNIKYNFLLQPFSDNYNYPLNMNNYKWGIDFVFPLFLRKERAELKLINLKIQQTKNEFQFKTQQTQNKLKIYFNNYLQYFNQLNFAIQLNNRYYQMLQAEIQNFKVGESNLFTINTRELYYLQSQAKVIEIAQKYYYYQSLLNIVRKYSLESM